MEGSLPDVTPFPDYPHPSEFLHLSEWDKMVNGFPYRPYHPDIRPLRKRCRDLIQEYNQTNFDDERGRRHILDELLDPSCKLNKRIKIQPPFRCGRGINIKVGECFSASSNCVILDHGPVQFGRNCRLDCGVHIYTAFHPLNAAHRQLSTEYDKLNYFEQTAGIRIGDNCWLGGGSAINPGVTLGNNVVVGAGSVVTKSFPDNVVVVGNPAQVTLRMKEPSVEPNPFWNDMADVEWRYD